MCACNGCYGIDVVRQYLHVYIFSVDILHRLKQLFGIVLVGNLHFITNANIFDHEYTALMVFYAILT